MPPSVGVIGSRAPYRYSPRWAQLDGLSWVTLRLRSRHPLILIRTCRFAGISLLLASTLLAAQSVTVSPTNLSLGNQAVSTTSGSKAVTLKNGQAVALTISSISTSGDFSQANTCGTSLAVGAKCTISVSFAPTVTGSRTGTLTVADNASNSPQTVSLTGTGIAQATISPATLSFGQQAVGTSSTAKTATLTNNLPTSLSVLSITASGDYAQTNTCGSLVAAGGTCTISVTFTPTTTGTRTGTLTVKDGASNSPQTVSLTGSGVLQATASPASLSFGNQAVGTSSTAKTATLTNDLPTSLTISSVTVSGDYTQTNTCGTSVAAGGTCTVSVTFTPTTTGSRTGTLTLTNSASNSPQTVSLTGNGVVPVKVSPTTLAFGNQAVTTTSATKTVTVSNNQPTAVVVSSITTPTAYAQTNTCGTLLAAQGTCTVSVTFSPTSTGSQPGTLTITDNASNSPQTVNLTGTGTALPTITGLSTTSGSVGTSVTITGTGFGGSQGNSTVTFNGLAATATTWKSTSIVATVPTAATTGNVVVTVNGGSSNRVAFTVVPNISSVSATSGIAGTLVTITGSGFGSLQGGSTVTFSGATATPTSWSPTSIAVSVPVAAIGGSGTVVVTVGGVASNGAQFTVVPNITNLSPTSGAVGASITITGTSFGSNQNGSMVAFSNTNATPTNWSAGSITVSVPAGAKTGNVVVTVGAVPSNGVGFTVLSGGFVATAGQMEVGRYGQTATQLTNGQLLIVGGMNSSGVVNSAEVYSLSSQSFAAASAMNVARWLHSATLLNDGTVLIAGGSSVSAQTTLNSAEIYDPVAGSFTLLPNTLNTARVGHTATLLSSGQVLIVGGYDPITGIIADSELYDPTAQVFIDLGNTNTPRFHHTATLLQNGQVLIAGGETDPTPSSAYNNAETFNSTTWTFTALATSMTSAREGHAATLLNDGTVLISGGDLPGTGSLNTAEIYNPSSGAFTAISAAMTSPRIFHNSVVLNGGKVLLSGGENDSGGTTAALNTAELYDPAAQTFTAVVGNLTSVREHQTSTLLNDGTVLEDGGTDGTNVLNTAEIYTTSKLTGLTSITISPASPSVPLGSQQLLTATGTFSGGGTQVLASVLWSSSSTSVVAVTNDASDTAFAATAAQGTSTLTASAAGMSGSTIVTVPAPTLVSIAVSPQTLNMPLRTVQQFDATGTYSDGSIQDLTSTATWTSSSSSATVSSAGLATAAALGNSTIQASSGSQSSSATVTVGSPALVSLSVTPSTAMIVVGRSQQYQATGIYTDGSSQNVTNSATWSAVPQTSGFVNSAGLATATGQGNISITAFYGGFDGVSTLTVGSPTLVSISVSPGTAAIPAGTNQQFFATGTYTDGTTQDLTSSVIWTSSSSTVSSISATGLATTLANGSTTISASSAAVTGTAALTVQTGTLALITSRYQHSATLLNNGSILIAGGVNCPSAASCTYLASTELYNPSSGTITNTGSMAAARTAPAILLGNAKVLIAGGYACDSNGNCTSLRSAEIYDPVAGTFSGTGNMIVDRYAQTMTLLNSGQVLIAGGETCTSATSCTALNTAELYNPATGTFTATGSLSAGRFKASAVALGSGEVLVAGGFDGTNYPAAAELYDPVAATFSTTRSLNTPRASATATLMNNGNVLIAGGSTCTTPGCPSSIAELYSNGNFFYFSYPTSNLTVARWNQSATLLSNGEVLLAGGYDACASSCTSDATTELFNPLQSGVATSQGLSAGRSGHTATLLTDGSVLLMGGINNGVTLSSVDSYVPSSLSLPYLSSITIAPSNQPLVLGTTLPLVAIGDNGTLQSVVWSSSSPDVASISNAAGSAGIVNSQSVGTATITASNGSISGSTQVTVTAPLVSIAISPSNPSVALNTSQELRFTATGTFSDGTSRDLTADVLWTTSNSLVATLIQNPTYEGVVAPVAVGTANIAANFGNLSASTAVTVFAPSVPVAPSIGTVSPTSGTAGTQVTLTGFGFGSVQAGGNVWLGSTLGTVVSWSDTQVVATVNTGSSSGIAQIQQNNLPSNTVPFTVNTATITSVSPNSGLPGTQVTITGSGFGAIQGSGLVWLGTAPAVVSSWSDGQVLATVANGSTSGNAQILQSGVWSNTVTFSIDSLQIASISPNSGPAGTVVTINGGGFGSVQGSGNVWIGNTYGIVVGWSDTQIVASVAGSAVTGVVKVEQNAAWSNALAFTVPTSFGGGTQVTLVPSQISMVVGDTRSIQAVGSNGQEITGLTWATSNTAVLTLSTDDPPMLTAVTPGVATINTGSASADVTVYAGPTFPIGTKIWSNSGDGSGVIKIIPAVPSASGGADVFALQQSGVVMALASDGKQLWAATVGAYSTLLPDFQGGLVVGGGPSGLPNQRLDGQTGQPTATFDGTPVLVHTDGTIFTDGFVSGIDSATGNQKFPPIQVEQGSYSIYDGGNCGEYTPILRQGPYSTFQPGPGIGQPIIAGDGYAYFPYMWGNETGTENVCDNGEPSGATHTDFHLRLLRVGTDGSSKEITLGDWASDSSNIAGNGTQTGGIPNVAGTLITNADQGVLYSWGQCLINHTTGLCNPQYNLTTVAADGSPTTAPTNIGGSNVPIPQYLLSPVQPVLQRADNSYIGLLTTFPQSSMVAFTASGQQLWSQPNYTPQIATVGGGVIATNSNSSQTVTFDSNGDQTGQLATLPVQTWKGLYQLGSVDSFYALLAALESDSYTAVDGGNVTGNGTAMKQATIGLYWCGTGYGEVSACPKVGAPDVQWKYLQEVNSDNFGKAVDFSVAQPNSPAHTDWVDSIEASALYALQQAFWQFPVTVRRSTPRKGSASECILSLQLPGCSVIDNDTDRVYVSGVWPGDGGTGETTGGLIPPPLSFVYYWISLQNSESYLHLDPPFPPHTDADNNAFARLLQGIGRGIGNAAAHELGHHVAYTFTINMDCRGDGCAGNNGIVFEKEGGYFEEYRYTYPNIQWQPNSVCAIKQYYNGEQWRDPKIGCTVDYFKKHF